MTTFGNTSSNIGTVEDRTVRIFERDVRVVVSHADEEGLEIVNVKSGKDIHGHRKRDITLRGVREIFDNFENKVKGVKYVQ